MKRARNLHSHLLSLLTSDKPSPIRKWLHKMTGQIITARVLISPYRLSITQQALLLYHDFLALQYFLFFQIWYDLVLIHHNPIILVCCYHVYRTTTQTHLHSNFVFRKVYFLLQNSRICMYLTSTCTNLGMFISLLPLVTRTSCLYSHISGFNQIILKMGKPTFLTPIDTRLAASWYLDFPYTLVMECLSIPLHLPTNPEPHYLIWTYCITPYSFSQPITYTQGWLARNPTAMSHMWQGFILSYPAYVYKYSLIIEFTRILYCDLRPCWTILASFDTAIGNINFSVGLPYNIFLTSSLYTHQLLE